MSNLLEYKDTNWIWRNVASFCEPEALAQLMRCSKALNSICSNDELYESICLSLGFKQLSMTKTRGKKPWKLVFLSSLCFECKSYRNIILLDINGGQETRWGSIDQPSSSLIPLCYNCYKVVNDIPMSIRVKKNIDGGCLPHTRMKINEYRFNALISIIPQPKAISCHKSKRKNSSTHHNSNNSSINTTITNERNRRKRRKNITTNDPLFNGATENNYLVKQLSKLNKITL